MSRFILIAGPQAAGKSTLISGLKEGVSKGDFLPGRNSGLGFFPLQESRQIICHKYLLQGAIFMTEEHEREVVQSDFCRMDRILDTDSANSVYVDECNIFTIAHAAAHGIDEVGEFWDRYIRRLERLDARVIFLDVPPEISWQRRIKSYRQRLVNFPESEHGEIMAKYRSYLDRLRPLLHDIYRRIPFPKEMLDSGAAPEEVYEKTVKLISP